LIDPQLQNTQQCPGNWFQQRGTVPAVNRKYWQAFVGIVSCVVPPQAGHVRTGSRTTAVKSLGSAPVGADQPVHSDPGFDKLVA